MSVSPTDALGTATSLLVSLVANSPAFQTRTSTNNPTSAAAKIFFPFLGLQNLPEPNQRPYAVIFRLPNESSYELRSGGSQNNLLPLGQMHLMLADNDQYPDGSIQDSLYDFGNFAGGVIQYLADNAASNGNLSIFRMSELVPPQYPATANQGGLEGDPWWWTEWGIEWGIGGR